ncbi:MAG: MFS transporter [Alphaproteobacteria bacterium]|nr:MAG: MFS transporter [Alphaproteobacteria bacterium]
MPPPPRRIFYGWYIVAGVFVITMTTSGLAFYNLSILLAAFVAERGFPVSLASSATATFFIASGIGGVISGRLVERIDARFVIATGATVGALALASVGSLRELWQLYAFHVVFGLCHGASGLVPLTTLVARWFSARRALAFSIASTGLSFGGIAVAPLVALLIERLGLAGAAPWMGLALCLGTLPVTLIVLRSRPAAMGLEPDGAVPAGGAPIAPQPAVAFGEARRSRYFFAVSVAYLFLLGAQVGAIAHFYRLASTRTGVATAALALSVLAGSSTVGRLLGGWLMLWIPSRPFALVLMVMQAAGLAVLAVAEDPAQILAGTVLFGVTMGNSLMMHPLLLAEKFGTRDYGRIYSTSQLVTVVGVAGCPPLIGLLYEASGGYAVPFLAVAGLTLVGLAVLGIFGAPRRLN